MKKKLFITPYYLILAITMLLLANSPSATGQPTRSAKAAGVQIAKELNDDRPVAILTRYTVKKKYQKKLGRLLKAYATLSRSKKNNTMAEAYYEQEAPTVLWVIERWNSKYEYEKTITGIRFKAIRHFAKATLSEPPRMTYMKDLEPLSKKEWRRSSAKGDKPLTIMLFVDAKAGTEDHFKDIYHKAMPQFRSESGVINYQLSQFEDDNTQFVTYEQFRNEDAFQYHLNFPPIQPVIDYLNTNIKKQPFQIGLHRLIELRFANK